MLSQDLVSLRSFHSILFFFRKHCDVARVDPSSCFVNIMFFPLLIHLTGVLCPLLKFFSSYQVSYHFSTGVLPEFVLPCSSFLTECFQLCSSSLVSFFHFAQPLKVHGFTRLSKKQFSLPLIVLLLFPLVPS